MKRAIVFAAVALGVFALISGCCMLPQKDPVQSVEVQEAERQPEASVSEAEPQAEPAAEPEPEPRDPGLYVQLFGSPDGSAAEAHVDIFTAGTDEKVAGDWVSGERRFTLPSGTYDLVAHVADARVRREGVEVSEEQYQPVDFVLDAGMLDVRFLDTEGGEPTNVEMWITHNETADDEHFFWDWRSEHEMLVPAGSYDIAANVADTTVWQRGVEVTAGGETEAEVILNAGTLELLVLDEADGELINATVSIFHSGEEEHFYWDFRRAVEILVPSGSYDVTVEYEDGTSVFYEGLEVTAGEITTKEVVPE